MKFLPMVLLVVLFASSCTYNQVISTKPINDDISVKNGYYVYENDTIRVTYDFWGSGGVVNMWVYNKADKPLYIDWSKSSFVYNDMKRSYWKDREMIKTKTVKRGGGIATPFAGTLYGATSERAYTTGTTEREERIAFIPPKTAALKMFGSIGSPLFYNTKDWPHKIVSEYKTDIWLYDLKGTAITFRNFLSYSLSADFEDESYVDNGFVVNDIRVIYGRKLKKYVDPKRFYKLYPTKESMKNVKYER